MAWTTPLTAVANAALTAAQWNASVRDNLNETAVGKATSGGQFFVSTAANTLAAYNTAHDQYDGGGTDTTNSTTYVALTGGAAVTVTTGTRAVVLNTSRMSHDTAGSRAWVTYAVSGATTIAASDSWAMPRDCETANRLSTQTYVSTHSDGTPGVLTSGSNTFTQNFRVTANIASFTNRRITVLPF